MSSFGGGGGPGGGISDLFNMGGGGFGNIMRGGASALSSSILGGSTAGITTAYAGGLNYRNDWGNGKLKLNGSYFGSQSNTLNNEERLRQTLLAEGGSFNNVQIGTSENLRNNHRINMNIEYQIDSLRSFIFRPNATLSAQNALNTNEYSSTTTENILLNNGNSFFDSQNNRPSIGANLLYRQRLKKAGRTFSLNLNTAYNDQETEQINQSDNRFFLPNGNLALDSTINQFSVQQSLNQRLGARVAYTEPLGKNKFLELNYDFNNNLQNSDRVTYDFNEATNRYDQINDIFSNQFENTFTTHQGGFNYRLQIPRTGRSLLPHFRQPLPGSPL